MTLPDMPSAIELERELRILVLEDNPADVALLEHEMRTGGLSFVFSVTEAEAAFVEQLEVFQPDLVVSDYSLPAFTGLDALKLVRERSWHLPFILLSGTIREQQAIEALRLSATDYLLKGQLARLVPAIRRALHDSQDRQNLEALTVAHAATEQASLAKSEFLSRMSHELRTPLNAVLGFAQLIELDATTDELSENAGRILQAGRHLLALINEVLEISRIEAGTLVVSLEPVLFGDVLSECLTMIAGQAGERRVELVDCDGYSGCFVRADRQRLRQVLLNLLSNAVKFDHKGGQVTVEVTSAGEERLRVSVSDTGRGIAPDALARLFVPFERLGAEGDGIEGTGLGLALSLRLVEAMGGTIGVQSTPGEGSTFWVELFTTNAPATAPIGDEDDDAEPRSGLDSTGTLLYIEDNLLNVRLVERILARRPGIRLLTTTLGAVGLELAASEQPGLVLLDLNLPDLPGDQVLARLRSDPHTKGIPVAMLSADASPSQIRRLREAGAYDYLTKPIDVGQLLGLLDQCFTPMTLRPGDRRVPGGSKNSRPVR